MAADGDCYAENLVERNEVHALCPLSCGVCYGATLRPTPEPTALPTFRPSERPTHFPTSLPTKVPTACEDISVLCTAMGEVGACYSQDATTKELMRKDCQYTCGTCADGTVHPTLVPTTDWSDTPTETPTNSPTFEVTGAPTETPSKGPSTPPSIVPTDFPTSQPFTFSPTRLPSRTPTTQPSAVPTYTPTHAEDCLHVMVQSIHPETISWEIYMTNLAEDDMLLMSDELSFWEGDYISPCYKLDELNSQCFLLVISNSELGSSSGIVQFSTLIGERTLYKSSKNDVDFEETFSRTDCIDEGWTPAPTTQACLEVRIVNVVNTNQTAGALEWMIYSAFHKNRLVSGNETGTKCWNPPDYSSCYDFEMYDPNGYLTNGYFEVLFGGREIYQGENFGEHDSRMICLGYNTPLPSKSPTTPPTVGGNLWLTLPEDVNMQEEAHFAILFQPAPTKQRNLTVQVSESCEVRLETGVYESNLLIDVIPGDHEKNLVLHCDLAYAEVAVTVSDLTYPEYHSKPSYLRVNGPAKVNYTINANAPSRLFLKGYGLTESGLIKFVNPMDPQRTHLDSFIISSSILDDGSIQSWVIDLSGLSNVESSYEIIFLFDGTGQDILVGSCEIVFIIETPAPTSLQITSPMLESAMLWEHGEAVTIYFDMPTNRGELEGVFTCSDVIIILSIGSDATCYWLDSSSIVALFGEDTIVSAGKTVGVVGGYIKNEAGTSASMTYLETTIQGPEVEKAPIAVIVGPNEGFLCETSIHFDGGQSTGGIIQYHWSIWPQPLVEFDNSGFYLDIPASAFNYGVYTIALTVGNRLDKTDTAQLNITFADDYGISITVLNGNYIYHPWESDLFIDVDVAVTQCSSSNLHPTFLWTQTQGPAISLSAWQQHTESLTIPATTLEAFFVYEFTFTVTAGDYVSSTAVVVEVLPLLVRSVDTLHSKIHTSQDEIDGGDITFYAKSMLYYEGNDLRENDYSYIWSLWESREKWDSSESSWPPDTTPPVYEIVQFSSQTGPNLTFPREVLWPGYLYLVQIKAESNWHNGTIATGSTYLWATSDYVARLDFANRDSTNLNVNGEVSMEFMVEPAISGTYAYSLKGEEDDVFSSNGNELIIDTTSASIMPGTEVTLDVTFIPENGLAVSFTRRRLSENIREWESSAARFSYVTNNAPFGGSCYIVEQVQMVAIYPYITEVEIRCSGWIDQEENYPLVYNFYLLDSESSIENQVYLSHFRTRSSLTFLLGQDVTGVVAVVEDSEEARTEYLVDIELTPYSPENNEMRTILESIDTQLTEAMESSDTGWFVRSILLCVDLLVHQTTVDCLDFLNCYEVLSKTTLWAVPTSEFMLQVTAILNQLTNLPECIPEDSVLSLLGVVKSVEAVVHLHSAVDAADQITVTRTLLNILANLASISMDNVEEIEEEMQRLLVLLTNYLGSSVEFVAEVVDVRAQAHPRSEAEDVSIPSTVTIGESEVEVPIELRTTPEYDESVLTIIELPYSYFNSSFSGGSSDSYSIEHVAITGDLGLAPCEGIQTYTLLGNMLNCSLELTSVSPSTFTDDCTQIRFELAHTSDVAYNVLSEIDSTQSTYLLPTCLQYVDDDWEDVGLLYNHTMEESICLYDQLGSYQLGTTELKPFDQTQIAIVDLTTDHRFDLLEIPVVVGLILLLLMIFAMCFPDSPDRTLPLVFRNVPEHGREDWFERSRSGAEHFILHSEEAEQEKCRTLLKLFVAITKNDHLVCGLLFRSEGTNFSVQERFLVLGVFCMTIIGATTLIYGTGINENLSNLVIWVLVVAAGAMLISQVFQWLFEYSTRLFPEEQPFDYKSRMQRTNDRQMMQEGTTDSEMHEQWQYDSPMRYGRPSPNEGPPVHYQQQVVPYDEPISESFEGPMPVQYGRYVPEGPPIWDQHQYPVGYVPSSMDEHDDQRQMEYADQEYWSPTSTYNRRPPNVVYHDEEDSDESDETPEEMDDDEEDESFGEGDIITYELNGQEMHGRVQQRISQDIYKLENGKLVSRDQMSKLEEYDLVESPRDPREILLALDSTDEDETEDDRYVRYVDEDEDGYDEPPEHPQHGILQRGQFIQRDDEYSTSQDYSPSDSDEESQGHHITPHRPIQRYLAAPTPGPNPPRPIPDIEKESLGTEQGRRKLRRIMSAPTPGYGYQRQLPVIDERRRRRVVDHELESSEEESPIVTRGEHYGRHYVDDPEEEYYRGSYPQRYTDEEDRYERFDEEKYVTTGSPETDYYNRRAVHNRRVLPPPFYRQGQYYDEEDEDDFESDVDQYSETEESITSEEGNYHQDRYYDSYEYERSPPRRDSGMDDHYGYVQQPNHVPVTSGYYDLADQESLYGRRPTEFEQQMRWFLHGHTDFEQRKKISDQNYFLPMWTRSCAWLFGLAWLLTALLCTAYYAGGLETTQIVEAIALEDESCFNPEESAWINEASKIDAYNSPENGVTKSQRTNWVLFIIAAAVVGLFAFSPAIFFLEASTSVLSLDNPNAGMEVKYEVIYFLANRYKNILG